MDDFDFLTPHWFVACQSSELRRKPIARTVLGQHLVLFRDAAGHPTALLDRCSHRNAPLSRGWMQAGRIVCPYHGWQFDGDGVCQMVPGLCGDAHHRTRNVPTYPVAERDGLVWIYGTSGTTDVALPQHVLSQPGDVSLVREFALEAHLLDALENFLDGTHTHFVHSGLVRSEGQRKRVRAIIRRGRDRVEAQYVDEGQQSGLVSRLFGGGVDSSLGRFILPSTVQLEYWARDRVKLLITIFFTPQTLTSLRVFAVVSGRPAPFPRWLVVPLLAPMLRSVVLQDRRILDLQLANLERFGGEHYTSTELDVLRPHIVRLLRGNYVGEDMQPVEREVVMLL